MLGRRLQLPLMLAKRWGAPLCKVLAVVLATGCQPARQRSFSAQASATRGSQTPGAEEACTITERPAPTGAFAREIASAATLLDVSNLMLLQHQQEWTARYAAPPTAPRSAASTDTSPEFPGDRFVEVRAFAQQFSDDGQQLLNGFMNGCAHGSFARSGRALSDDGRLCPAVDRRAQRLTADQTARLLELAKAPRPAKVRYCSFMPRHAFVFFDAAGAPVADLSVSFHCGKWSLSGAEPVEFSQQVWVDLRALCVELGLSGCPLANDEDEQAFQDAYARWYASGALPRPSRTFGIAPSRTLASLSHDERLALCAWRVIELQAWHFAPAGAGDQGTIPLMSLQTCVDQFPDCPLTLGVVEQTDFRRASGDAGAFAASPACRARWLRPPLRACLWGMNPALFDAE